MTLRFHATALFLLLFATGCGRQASENNAASASEPVLVRQYRQQSVTAIISVSETNITTTGRIQLTLDVQVPPDAEVDFPEVGHSIEPFTISGSYSEPKQTLPNGKTLHRRVWLLVPSLPGEVDFKPLEIIVGGNSLKTGPISISVRSILPEGLDAYEIRDIAAPAILLPEQKQKQRLWLILLGSIIAPVLIVAGIHLSNKSKISIPTPPHTTAFQALEKLEAEDPGPVLFVHELNHILRSYLNARSNIPALESTSSELAPMLDHPELIQFLSDCDGIKFAHAVPPGFAKSALDFVRSYIEATKPEEEPCA